MAAVELTPGVRTPVVVMGASNVSRGLARLAAVVRSRVASPVDLFVAAGHGRGYALATRVGLRRLPSILGSGLWRSLERQGIERPLVLVTDVGNELLYGLGVAGLARAVRTAAGRLADAGARVAITGLPLESVARVGRARYRLLRTCYVPGCTIPLGDLKEATVWLDDELRAAAADIGGRYIPQPGLWYGFDALHLRRRRLDDLWHAAGDAWGLPSAAARGRWRDWATLGSRAAEVRSLARRVRYVPQPVVDHRDLRVWMY